VEWAKIEAFCKENGKEANDAALDDLAVKQAVLDDLNGLAVEAKFISLEKPGQMMLIKEPWSIDNGYLTPTMKMKRATAREKLASEI
jgi:long-chain acyl-CoA synthetase